MNRDELFSRPRALPPKIIGKGAMEMVYPRESSGGTWIACNGRGNLLALLNWNGSESHNLGEKRRTRGLVIPELASELDSRATDSHFRRMNLHGMFPYRLVGFFRSERVINEWSWDGLARRKRGILLGSQTLVFIKSLRFIGGKRAGTNMRNSSRRARDRE